MAKPAKAVEGGYQKLKLDLLEPNPWNPNRMAGELFEKLVRNIEDGLKNKLNLKKALPPIVVRPHPTEKGKFQIIDGFHRFKAHKSLRLDDIDAFVMDVDDAAARLLTLNLNYLRGEKDPEKYTNVLIDLLKNTSVEHLAGILPEDQNALVDLITVYGDGEAIRKMLDAVDESAPSKPATGDAFNEDDIFVDITFNVSVSQAKVIKQEIARIKKVLVGNNLDGRALEFMAAQSASTDLPPDLVASAKDERARLKEAKKQKSKPDVEEQVDTKQGLRAKLEKAKAAARE